MRTARSEGEDGWWFESADRAVFKKQGVEMARVWLTGLRPDRYEGRIWYSPTDDSDSKVFDLGVGNIKSAVEALNKLMP